ncbi:MAG: TlyA family RNA methyltransferase [Proteobacteria bacterium]|nr:TlyA family RNA methyltransferase [Pseudomonadota bacterium]
MTAEKKRLDAIMVDKGLVQNRSRAQSLIMAGKVYVNNSPLDKPGHRVSENDDIVLKEADFPFVSRGALKLDEALKQTGQKISDLVCLDVGASTGGFTDCLLQRGAKRVYAVDVGYGQLAWKLRQDPKVVVIERTNIRYLAADKIPDKIDIAVIDTSFISLKIVIPAVLKFLNDYATIYALIKPQFEVGKGKVGKGGVVKDEKLHDEVIEELSSFFYRTGLEREIIVPSPVLGPKGNKEFVVVLTYKKSVE